MLVLRVAWEGGRWAVYVVGGELAGRNVVSRENRIRAAAFAAVCPEK